MTTAGTSCHHKYLNIQKVITFAVTKNTIRNYGKPVQILTDHGKQFYNKYCKSDFDIFFVQDNRTCHVSNCNPNNTR